MRRRALLLVAVLAACSAPGVTSESARQQPAAVTDPPVVTPAPAPPPTTDPPPPTEAAPPETSAPERTEPEPTEPTEPSVTATEETDAPPPTDTGTTDPTGGLESIGDSLFPDLGTDDLDVQSYDVRLDYDPATRVIDGAVSLRTVVLGAPERLVLDAVDVGVEEVTVDGVAAEFELADGELVITPAAPAPAGTPVTIDVGYTDEAQRSGAFDGLASKLSRWTKTTA